MNDSSSEVGGDVGSAASEGVGPPSREPRPRRVPEARARPAAGPLTILLVVVAAGSAGGFFQRHALREARVANEVIEALGHAATVADTARLAGAVLARWHLVRKDVADSAEHRYIFNRLSRGLGAVTWDLVDVADVLFEFNDWSSVDVCSYTIEHGATTKFGHSASFHGTYAQWSARMHYVVGEAPDVVMV